jgi:hypothetical protein
MAHGTDTRAVASIAKLTMSTATRTGRARRTRRIAPSTMTTARRLLGGRRYIRRIFVLIACRAHCQRVVSGRDFLLGNICRRRRTLRFGLRRRCHRWRVLRSDPPMLPVARGEHHHRQHQEHTINLIHIVSFLSYGSFIDIETKTSRNITVRNEKIFLSILLHLLSDALFPTFDRYYSSPRPIEKITA